MKDYTVVGVYDDNHQPYCDHVKAASPAQATRDALTQNFSVDLRVLCVFEGKHIDVLEASSDDTGYLIEDFCVDNDDDDDDDSSTDT